MTLRPFYIVVVVWGREFRDYFLEYCLPSLLSPNNLPALVGRRPVKLLMATTAEDWDTASKTAVFRELKKVAEPVFLELPAKGDTPYWLHSIYGHQACCEMAVRDKAYRILVCPDTLYSDGALSRLHDLACNGAQAVLKLVSPLTKTDRFFKALADHGMLPEQSARDTGHALTCTSRQLVKLATAAMHGATAINEWDATYFCGYASTPWWKVPGADTMISFGMRWDLLLVDYSAVSHDSAILNERGFDGDYIMRTIGDLETIYFVRDSDELHVVSWASFPDQPLRMQPYGEMGRGIGFRASAYGPQFNSMQRALLFLPTLVHSDPLNGAVPAAEDRALRTLLTWVDPPRDLERMSRGLPPAYQTYRGIDARLAAIRLPWWRSNPLAWATCRTVVLPAVARLSADRPLISLPRIPGLSIAGVLARRAALALAGDRAALQWWRWVLRKLASRLLRRPFNEPRPEV